MMTFNFGVQCKVVLRSVCAHISWTISLIIVLMSYGYFYRLLMYIFSSRINKMCRRLLVRKKMELKEPRVISVQLYRSLRVQSGVLWKFGREEHGVGRWQIPSNLPKKNWKHALESDGRLLRKQCIRPHVFSEKNLFLSYCLIC